MEKDIKRQTIDSDMLKPVNQDSYGPATKEEYVVTIELTSIFKWLKTLFKKEKSK